MLLLAYPPLSVLDIFVELHQIKPEECLYESLGILIGVAAAVMVVMITEWTDMIKGMMKMGVMEDTFEAEDNHKYSFPGGFLKLAVIAARLLP